MSKQLTRVLTIVMMLMVAMPIGLHARRLRKHPEYHYFTISLSAGGSGILQDFEPLKSKPGLGATFGLGYEYHYRAFWLSLGLEGQLFQANFNQLFSDTLNYQFHDTEMDPITYYYTMNRWRENHTAVYANFPVMLGFNIKRFYMGVGGKVGISFYGHNNTTIDYRTAGVYDWACEDFQNQPNHYYSDYQSYDINPDNGSKGRPIAYQPKISAIAEIGYEAVNIPKKKDGGLPMILKLGAYAEYGLMNVLNNTNEQAYYIIDANDASKLLPTPFFHYTPTAGHQTLPLYVGIKATLMFELPLPQKCHCIQTERGASWRNDASRETKKASRQARRGQKVNKK